MIPTQPDQRQQEDALVETYQKSYANGTYAFGTAGGDSGCSLSWAFNGNGQPWWVYLCSNGPVFVNDQDATRYQHGKTCTGYYDDFENFYCDLTVLALKDENGTRYNENGKRYDTALQVSIECHGGEDAAKRNNGCTCTPQANSLREETCDSCRLCSSPLHLLQNFTTDKDLKGLELSCSSHATQGIYNVSQSCPPSLSWTPNDVPSSSMIENGWFMAGIVVGVVSVAIMGVHYVWTRIRHGTKQNYQSTMMDTNIAPPIDEP